MPFASLLVFVATPYVPIYEAMPSRAALSRPVPELKQIAWMKGTWRCHMHTFAVGSAPAHDAAQELYTAKFIMRNALNGEQSWLQVEDAKQRDLSFITFDPMAKRWVVTGIEWPVTYGTTVGMMMGNRLVATGTVTVFGRDYILRQTYTKLNNDAFRIFNEEQRPDGSWLPDDEYDFVRVHRKKA